jgi:diaminohydroxyphosphoribosylaminopyrimidine deaminase/5-amino-6-(5-phosphoribosylamino)uracil reductase
VNTVVRDNPELTVRRVELGSGKQPLRIILDRTLRTPKSATLVSDEHKTLILHCDGSGDGLECETILMPPLFSESEEGVDLVQLLDLLGDREIQNLLVEGGPDVWAKFLADDLVDEAYIFHSKADLGEGLNSGISNTVLKAAGLHLVEERESGVDTLQIWNRN